MIEIIYGKNLYKIQQLVQEKITSYYDEHGQESVTRFDAMGADWAAFHQAVEGISLFGSEHKLVIVRDIENNKSLGSKLAEEIQDLSSSTYIVIVSPAIDKRSVLFKTIKKEGLATECAELKAYDLVRWAREYVTTQKGQISEADARFLVERVGESQLLIASELTKLLIHGPEVTRQTIEVLVEPTLRDTIFELLDATTSGQQHKASTIYMNLRAAQVQPIYVLTMIGWQLHALLAVQLAGAQTDAAIAAESGISPFVIGKAKKLMRRIDGDILQEMIERAALTDSQLKSTARNPDDAMQALIMRIALLSEKK